MKVRPQSLNEWLDHIGQVHPVGIDLGLERIGEVARRMEFASPGHRPAPCSVIVAGTNGKGSTCIALEALLAAAGLSVGTTLSPHLHVFNERVRVEGAMVDDALLCDAFARVEYARAGVPLTYFEFSALVALDCFRRAKVDVAILEVGLGGRLDAFNLVHADVAVITSIGLEHQAYLGDDLDSIGREKAGVMRAGQRVVLGADVSPSVEDAARQLGCRRARLGADFHLRQHGDHWDFLGTSRRVDSVPLGALAPPNCALALEAADQLAAALTGEAYPRAGAGDGRWSLPLDAQDVREALLRVSLPGRTEVWHAGSPPRLLVVDVAHNPAGARFLGEQLSLRFPGKRFVAVLGMLADKDCAAAVAALNDHVRFWVCVPTRGARGQAAETLATRIAGQTTGGCTAAAGVVQGLDRAFSWCGPGDAILALGSFDLVEQMREALLAGHAGGGSPVPG